MIDLPTEAGRALIAAGGTGGTCTRRSLLPAACLIAVGLWTGSVQSEALSTTRPRGRHTASPSSVSGLRGKICWLEAWVSSGSSGR